MDVVAAWDMDAAATRDVDAGATRDMDAGSHAAQRGHMWTGPPPPQTCRERQPLGVSRQTCLLGQSGITQGAAATGKARDAWWGR